MRRTAVTQVVATVAMAVVVVPVCFVVIAFITVAPSPVVPVLGFSIINPMHNKNTNIQLSQYSYNDVLHRIDTKMASIHGRRESINSRKLNHHTDEHNDEHHIDNPQLSLLPTTNHHRRHLLRQLAFIVTTATTLSLPAAVQQPQQLLLRLPANAFANKISNQYDDRPKRRGPQVMFFSLSLKRKREVTAASDTLTKFYLTLLDD